MAKFENKRESMILSRINALPASSDKGKTPNDTVIKMIPVDDITPFKNHPFKVLDDEDMQSLISSVREKGIINPVIVRKIDDGLYEMISGHRRLHAANTIGLLKIPAYVKEYSDDEATIVMVDSNLQRTDILPSEKAKSLYMKNEALKHQGVAGNGRTIDLLAGDSSESAATIARWISLIKLIPGLMDLIDSKRLSLSVGYEAAMIPTDIQEYILDYISDKRVFKIADARKIKDNIPSIKSKDDVISLLNPAKPVRTKKKITITNLDYYFPETTNEKERTDIICKLLEKWKNGEIDI